MALPQTQHFLDKLESLFKALGYRIRFEKGNFKTGACKIESSRIIVVNKFSSLDSKIQALVEILQQLEEQPENQLDEKQKHLFNSLKQTRLHL